MHNMHLLVHLCNCLLIVHYGAQPNCSTFCKKWKKSMDKCNMLHALCIGHQHHHALRLKNLHNLIYDIYHVNCTCASLWEICKFKMSPASWNLPMFSPAFVFTVRTTRSNINTHWWMLLVLSIQQQDPGLTYRCTI